jgi:hypothetical protein
VVNAHLFTIKKQCSSLLYHIRVKLKQNSELIHNTTFGLVPENKPRNFFKKYTHSQPTTENQRDQNFPTYSVKQNRSREQKKSPHLAHSAMAERRPTSFLPIGGQSLEIPSISSSQFSEGKPSVLEGCKCMNGGQVLESYVCNAIDP